MINFKLFRLSPLATAVMAFAFGVATTHYVMSRKQKQHDQEELAIMKANRNAWRAVAISMRKELKTFEEIRTEVEVVLRGRIDDLKDKLD